MACSDPSSGAFRTGGVRNWGHLELGAQSGRKNQARCAGNNLVKHLYAVIANFNLIRLRMGKQWSSCIAGVM